MPIYFFWGEDDFAIAKSIEQLENRVLDPNWLQFNYHKLRCDRPEHIIDGLNHTITPVFGMGERLTWLVDTNICQQCSEDLLSELQRTLPIVPDNSHLLFTSAKKPDARLKSTKLLQKYARIQEFSLIPPWKVEEITQQVKQVAKQIGVKLTPAAVELLAEAVGNNTRQLWLELEKLSLYRSNKDEILDADVVANLVVANTQNSLQLAKSILNREVSLALSLAKDLIDRNEPPLKIVATLVGQFRTWTIIKSAIESGEKDDKVIASLADVANPYRIPHLRKEIYNSSSKQLLDSLPILLELEFKLKQGSDPLSTLQAKIIQLCSLHK
jgi:DNA polymerase III subunit delta